MGQFDAARPTVVEPGVVQPTRHVDDFADHVDEGQYLHGLGQRRGAGVSAQYAAAHELRLLQPYVLPAGNTEWVVLLHRIELDATQRPARRGDRTAGLCVGISRYVFVFQRSRSAQGDASAKEHLAVLWNGLRKPGHGCIGKLDIDAWLV